jgi:hypothetical protein
MEQKPLPNVHQEDSFCPLIPHCFLDYGNPERTKMASVAGGYSREVFAILSQ